MGNEITITCFTDLKGSTETTETLGHEGVRPFRDEYLRVGKILSEKTKGTYIKNIGDAHMIKFNEIEGAFCFAAQLQQFYQPQPHYQKAPLESRVGLSLGVTESCSSDVFGSGVNMASRVEGMAQPGAIWLNEDLFKAAQKVWGKVKTDEYISLEGNFKLKGFDDEIALFSFNWQEYLKQRPEHSLSKLIQEHLRGASVIDSNFRIEDISNHLPVIWPVVPRDGVNAIHCGQLEIIRLLAMVGSKVHVLIADCGATNNPTREYSEAFKENIDAHAKRRGLKDIEYSFMSDLFQPRCNGCDRFHHHFQTVISQLTLDDLLAINNKQYAQDVKDSIKQAPTLGFLHPALIISAVIHLSTEMNEKCIVVAGRDEQIQWENAHQAIPSARGGFGVLFNPKLMRKAGDTQGRQTHNWPMYFNWPAIVQEMETWNLAQWLTQLHLFLAVFPATTIDINGTQFNPSDWQNNEEFENQVDKNALAQQALTILRNQ